MKLAMILGKKQGEAIKPRLQNIKDNLDIDVFDDVPEFIFNVSKRNTIYDRILVLSTKITPATLKDLNNAWGMYSKETAVIMLSRKDADEAKAKAFLETFKTPVACAMLVSNTTVSVIAESVLRPTGELNAEYGYKDFLAVELEEDEFVPPPPPPPPQLQTPPPEQQAPQKGRRDRRERQPKKKKKGSLLGGIFGSRGSFDDDDDEQEQQAQQYEQPMQPQDQLQAQQQMPVQQQMPQPPYQPPQSPVQMPNAHIQQAIPQQQPVQQAMPQQPAPAPQPQEENWDAQGGGYEDEWEPAGATMPSEMQSDGSDDDFGADFGSEGLGYEEEAPAGPSAAIGPNDPWGTQPAPQPQRPPMQQAQAPIYSQPQMPSQPQFPNVVPQQASSEVDMVFDSGFSEDFSQQNDFTPEAATADVDFGSDGILSHAQPEQAQRPQRAAEQADENFGDLSIVAEEAQYRKQKEAPKVITKTVHTPVLGSGSALKGVLSGRLKKVIIVTGDRGAGLTSTALSLANALKKHVDVLYFDCDTANHGLLNYIDYMDFKNYEQTHQEGNKVCKSSMMFERCVLPLEDTLGILTSDFSCDVEDEDLQRTAQVVAEHAPDFGVVVVDCPVDKLYCVTDLLMTGQVVVCVEGSKRGFMNMLCRLESSTTPVRFKRNMISRGTMFITKMSSKVDMKRLLAYIKSIYQPDAGIDWLSLPVVPFNGKVSDALLNQVLEG